jgi:transcription elongation GreA/GreB family factor
MHKTTDKITALELLANRFRQLMRNAEKERADAQYEANSHVGAVESRYDTFKEEAQYLVQAHQKRVYELDSGIQTIESLIVILKSERSVSDKRVRLGCIVLLEDASGNESSLFVSPFGGGETLKVGEKVCRVITPASPLGKAIINHLEEDEVEAPAGGKTEIYWIKAVL